MLFDVTMYERKKSDPVGDYYLDMESDELPLPTPRQSSTSPPPPIDHYDEIEVYEYKGFRTGDTVIRGNGQKGLVEKGGIRKVTIVWSADNRHPNPTKVTHSREELELMCVRYHHPELGSKSLPNSTPQLGSKSLPDSTPQLGSKSLPNSTPQLGSKSLPNSTPQLGSKSLPNSTPQLGSKSLPNSLEPFSSPDLDITELMQNYAAGWTADQIEEAIAFLQSLQPPQNAQAPTPRNRFVELKMVRNKSGQFGPYAYERWYEGGILRSRYLGKIT